jgi:hypothetical protein
VDFPLGWLLDHGAAPIRYRALVDVAGLGIDGGLVGLATAHVPALTLAVQQRLDGTWGGAMLSLPSGRAEHFEGIGTVPAVRRLLEYGWDRDTPSLMQARRPLFRLLAEDDDPSQLYEFAKPKLDEDEARMLRQTLREAAAATLAQAGYEQDPRLRGAARRTLDRLREFLESPLAEKPWVRVGNRQVLAAEAFPPSVYTLLMLAHMPLFRSEHAEEMELLYRWLSHALPRQESFQVVGTRILEVPHLVLGDQLPHRNALDADVPSALAWLELMARLGFLRRHETWSKLLERFLDDRDRGGVWHPHKGMAAPRSGNPFVWPSFPLEELHGGDERWIDVTFRLGLIAKLSGRPIELM